MMYHHLAVRSCMIELMSTYAHTITAFMIWDMPNLCCFNKAWAGAATEDRLRGFAARYQFQFHACPISGSRL